jgi:hypothetical protein
MLLISFDQLTVRQLYKLDQGVNNLVEQGQRPSIFARFSRQRTVKVVKSINYAYSLNGDQALAKHIKVKNDNRHDKSSVCR